MILRKINMCLFRETVCELRERVSHGKHHFLENFTVFLTGRKSTWSDSCRESGDIHPLPVPLARHTQARFVFLPQGGRRCLSSVINSIQLDRDSYPLPHIREVEGHSYLTPPWVTSLARPISRSPGRKTLTDLGQV